RSDDFFAESGQSCEFPVLGSWDVTVNVTTYFYPGTEQAARIVTDVEFDGALSIPLSGKSVADASHHDMKTDYFAPDGTYLKPAGMIVCKPLRGRGRGGERRYRLL